ncbi:MAG: hypothetical protein O2951_09560 [Bacteroidetes bacterium]|nr:hypothetical protein [Bacteroidota bacterium]
MKELLSGFLFLFTGEDKEYSWKEIIIGLTVITAFVLLVWQSINVVNEASEIKFRAERRAGELIKEGQERGDLRKNGQRGSSFSGVEELGITRKQSSTFYG